MTDYPVYCGGKFITTGDELKVFNPYKGENFAKTYLAGMQELENAIAAAQKVEDDLRDIPSHNKYKILMQIAMAMESSRDEFAALLSRESAKPMRYARGEIDRAIQTFTVAAEEAKRLPREYISLDWTQPGKNKEGLVKYFPIGLVAGISPFNFPMNLAVHKIAPAIAAGCPIILKPASKTPLSTLKLAQLIDKTELPKGAVSILPMNRDTGNKLVTDERFKLLTFTGSPAVGWKMKNQAGKKKVVLELGGNAGVIVTETADIEYAVERCLIGGFAYSGQVCIHAQRIYVADEIFNEFLTRFVRKVETLKQGDPLLPETDISSMIDKDNAERVIEWLEEAVRDGAKILSGGAHKEGYVSPTIITQTKRDMKVCALEIFGPVVVIEKYESFEHAVEMINDSDFGLQAGVFTNKIDEMNYAFNRIKVGGLIINDVPTFRVDHMPYGGVKDSGLGREGVKYSIRDMMEAKILVKNFK